MSDFDSFGRGTAGFDRCEIGNNTPQLEAMAENARAGANKPFDPTAEVSHIRQMAYDALHGDSQAPSNQLWNEIQSLHQVPKLEAQVLQKLSEPDVTRRMPVAKVDIDERKGMTGVSFEPGCLDFGAKTANIVFPILKPEK